MIIGLIGKRQAGKDTAGAYLVKKHGFERKAFADPLKRSVATLFDIPYSEVDKLKLGDNISVTLDHYVGDEVGEVFSTMTFRQFLQRYGTEAHRGTFGDNFWVDQALPVAGYYAGRAIVITDCRFENEAERIHLLGGIIVKIERPGLDDKDPHSSETEMEKIQPDYVIMNDGTIESFYLEIDRVLIQ